MARRIEIWPIDRLVPYARNARTHSPEQVAQIAASIVEFGFVNPILVDSNAGIIAGHGRLLAARKLGLPEAPVVVLDHLTETQRRAYIIADNKLALNAGWDEKVLAAELRELEGEGLDLAVVGFSDEELESLLVEPEVPDDAEEDVPEPPANPVTRPGDVWLIGKHRLVCGDCRDRNTLRHIIPARYARERLHHVAAIRHAARVRLRPAGLSRFRRRSTWNGSARWPAAVESVLAPDGSYLPEHQAHADEGERNLYVMDLVLAHRRQWGWRFVDEFCWRKTDNGVPGGWGNRFKNAFEPIYHFCRQQRIKFRPQAVGHESDDCFEYSPNNPKSRSGSGLLGTGVRGAAADGGKNQGAWGRTRSSLSSDSEGRHTGLARPSNVIEVKSESSQGSHSAPFPRALVEFFLLAFSDVGDVIHDPFLGSGTTMAAADVLGRRGYGAEISAGYCDVILRRMINLTGEMPMLNGAESFTAVAEARGVTIDQALNPKASDSRAIRHHGPNPFYGPKRKAS